jgi:formylglycine-generating enzyme
MAFRSDSEHARARRALFAAFVVLASLAGCRFFVDTDGLGDGVASREGGKEDGNGTDVGNGPVSDSGPRDATEEPTVIPPVDAGDGAVACPSTGGPTPVRVTANGTSFCIDSSEVTRGQYKTWLDTNPSTAGQSASCAWNTSFTPLDVWPPGPPQMNLPVGGVDWCDAVAFCKWAGKRLCGKVGGGGLSGGEVFDPQKNQWFFACSKAGAQTYPYGNAYNGTACNGGDKGIGQPLAAKSLSTCEGGFDGVFDLSGNAHEWVDACGPGTNTASCRISQSAWTHSSADMACNTFEELARDYHEDEVTFRCCSD